MSRDMRHGWNNYLTCSQVLSHVKAGDDSMSDIEVGVHLELRDLVGHLKEGFRIHNEWQWDGDDQVRTELANNTRPRQGYGDYACLH